MSDLDLDLDSLEAVAQAATPGEWHPATTGVESGDHWSVIEYPAMLPVCRIPSQDGSNEDQREPDARHIATFDPPTVLALIAELRDSRARIAEVEAERDLVVLDAIKAVRDRAADERVAMHAQGEPLTEYSSGVLDGIDKAWIAGRKAATRPIDNRTKTSVEEWWACDDAYEEGLAAGRGAAEQKVAALAEVIEQVLGPDSFRALGVAIHRFRCTNPDCRHHVDAGYFTPRDNDGASACQQWLRAALAAAPSPSAEAEEVPAICEHGYFGPHQTPLLADDMPDGSTRHAGWTTCPGPTPPTTDAEEARDV